MPAVDVRLAAGAPGNSYADPAENSSGQLSTGDHFDHAMKRALAPDAQKSPAGKIAARPGKNGATKTPAPADEPPAASADAKSSDGKTARAISTVKSGAAADETFSPAANALHIPSEAPTPASGFLMPPPFSFFGASPVAPDAKLSSPANKLSFANLPLAATAATAAVKTAVVDLDGNPETSLVPAAKNSLLQILSPVTAAEAAELGKTISADSAKKAAPENVAPPVPEPKNAASAELAVPADGEKTLETQADSGSLPATDAADKAFDLNPAAASERAAANAGTGVAMTDLPMKNPQKANKVAGPDVKVLPVSETGVAREKNLPTPLLGTPGRAMENRGADLNFSFSSGSGNAPVADNAPVLNAVDLPSLADARMRAVERAHDMMALHSMRLLESKSDALSVVIKPAVGTELSLELRQRNGGVEAQATLTRGDHQFLSQHWPELQQRLEQRGIKLAPLGGEANFSTAGDGSFQQDQASREEAAQQASAFAEFASAGFAGGATARLAVAHDGWESWA